MRKALEWHKMAINHCLANDLEPLAERILLSPFSSFFFSSSCVMTSWRWANVELCGIFFFFYCKSHFSECVFKWGQSLESFYKMLFRVPELVFFFFFFLISQYSRVERVSAENTFFHSIIGRQVIYFHLKIYLRKWLILFNMETHHWTN